jgi:hypothetical protein
MPRMRLGGWAALAALFSLSGCCSFCDKFCSHPVSYVPQQAPVCCQPVCCQPVATGAPAPVVAQPQQTWQNPTAAPRTGFYYDPCACSPY